MFKSVSRFFRRERKESGFSCHGFEVIGHRYYADSPDRILILADAYGPTLQINFIRPLRYQNNTQRKAAWWILTENSISQRLLSSNKEDTLISLERLIELLRPTTIVATRYAGPIFDDIIRFSNLYNIPLVYHLDDNLLNVPTTNGQLSFQKHAMQSRQQAMRALAAKADLCYISTRALYEQLNALDVLGRETIIGSIAGAASPMTTHRRPGSPGLSFGYMGSQSHTSDLEMIAPAIVRILEEYPTVKFEIFGSVKLPPTLERFAVKRHRRVKSYDDFLQKLTTLNWEFGLAPLAANNFTAAKTNVKWIEYTAAGIPVIASNHLIYQDCCSNDCGLLVDNDWPGALRQMIEQPATREKIRDCARHRLEREYSPARLQKQVSAIFQAAAVLKLESMDKTLPETASTLL